MEVSHFCLPFLLSSSQACAWAPETISGIPCLACVPLSLEEVREIQSVEGFITKKMVLHC